MIALLAQAVGPPTVRLLPAPRCEPPTDAELAASGAGPPLPEAAPLPLDLPARPVTGSTPPDPPGRSGASTARLATRRFLAACLEVVGGFRPVAHLRPLCQSDRFDDIAAGLRIAPGTPKVPGSTTSGPRATRVAAPRAGTTKVTRGGTRGAAGHAAHGVPRRPLPRSATLVRGSEGPDVDGRPRVSGAAVPVGVLMADSAPAGHSVRTAAARIELRRVQICEAVDGVAEVAAVLARRDQVWAMAIRMEQVGGRWVCTHLEVL